MGASGKSDLHRSILRYRGFMCLLVSVMVLGGFWLAVLPWLAARPAIRSHWQWLDEQGIDPSAKFYTDLPVMKEILKRRERREHSGREN
jgi:hypothetical protein